MKYNIDTKVDGVRSTVMQLPDWAGGAADMLPSSSGTLTDRLANISPQTLRIRGITATQESSKFRPEGVMGSNIYDEPLTLDPSKISNWARDTTPVEDEPDVTDWMVSAKAAVATMKARSNEYARAGSKMAVAAGDPFVPGVNNGQMAFVSERGSVVSDRGTANVKLATNQTAEVSVPGSTTIIRPNMLGWAAGTELLERQWTGTLMSMEELTNNPSSPIGFPNIAGESGPLFVGHSPSRRALVNRVSMGLQSDQNQNIKVNLRSPNNYTRTLNSFNIDVPKGKSSVSFRTLSLGVSPMVAEIQPENGTQTVLTDYSVAP